VESAVRVLLAIAVAAAIALTAIGCAPQPSILSTISCPVYVPPETPQPNWPKACGGER
jgi:hypothetical protein